jgi:hypothetical protein
MQPSQPPTVPIKIEKADEQHPNIQRGWGFEPREFVFTPSDLSSRILELERRLALCEYALKVLHVNPSILY